MLRFEYLNNRNKYEKIQTISKLNQSKQTINDDEELQDIFKSYAIFLHILRKTLEENEQPFLFQLYW